MGQETYTRQHSTSTQVNAVPVDGDSPGYSKTSEILLEQPFVGDSSAVEPSVVLSGQQTAKSDISEFFIRCFDVAGSIFILLLTAPVMIFVALLIKLTSVGPVVFQQRRVGKNYKIFKLYKFRTMINDAEKHTGPIWAARDDGRVTPFGKMLRRTRLDELPQLFNVLNGDMSLVGPRPERPYFVRKHRALQGVRLAVKPGITGLAQIRAFYDLKPEHKLRYDYLYIQKRSFSLNTYILFKTVPVVLLRKGW
jgi:lipopolysaccharide/colanic/teichoic acid biosynthesis glycosyltransferase